MDSDGSLKEKFPRLYLISLCKDKVISEVGEWASIGAVKCVLGIYLREESCLCGKKNKNSS